MPRAAVVCGLGSYLPEAVLSNDMLAAELDTSDAWISSRTGVRQRHIAGDLGIGDPPFHGEFAGDRGES
ncbi:hypothetical protein K3Z96_19600, partial [Pseudomonas aeruginosa]|nr:hypothetical protein [Pseudomonas aeruginosa]